MKARVAAIVLFLLLCGCGLGAEDITFHSGGNRLAGIFLPPDTNTQPCGVIVTVHGDGPLDREAFGYYPLIWELLRARGYAVLSWDKPGIGGSTGNWLHQSMEDRQREVSAAIEYIERRFAPNQLSIGLLGFSQAGWVVPAVANQNPSVDFVIGVGFAINWIEQGWYLTLSRLQGEGASESEIDEARTQYIDDMAFLATMPTYEAYLASVDAGEKPMSRDRYGFALKNVQADAMDDYRQLHKPLLMLLGEDDLNVDIVDTRDRLAALSATHPSFRTVVLPAATHSLLKSRQFNTQSPGLLFLAKLHLFGDSAVSPQLEPVLDEWLSDRVCSG
ncbi:alpha/beta fold hydrolase [Microbulbifer sp. SH-1]|uniref:alpha/beta hydrolase family protein n=1 Tax=Microbulbifer sp. SH-1 TaxID=2681547 RepID=UPI00140BF180|nr:alpha/beta fold hydrolase [Microbulbifer sp. SH-1]QIL88695.1 alpha/beta fold hydrolase [Microbulbifer sp. SH-1]